MPIKFYAKGRKEAEPNSAFYLLKYRPNPQMTPTTFWTAVENNRNHFGNAYVWIQTEFNRMKYGGDYKIKNLWIMPSNDVTVIVDDKGIFGGKGKLYYWYTDKYSGESYFFPEYEVMHFKTSTTFDGITGESVRSILKATIAGALASQNFKNKLYEGGLTARAALQYTGDLEPKKEKALIAKFEKYATGVNNAGKFIPVPIGMKIEPLSISLTDSQYYELSKYTALGVQIGFNLGFSIYIGWYTVAVLLINELTSILENLYVIMPEKVPVWLVKILKIADDKLDHKINDIVCKNQNCDECSIKERCNHYAEKQG